MHGIPFAPENRHRLSPYYIRECITYTLKLFGEFVTHTHTHEERKKHKQKRGERNNWPRPTVETGTEPSATSSMISIQNRKICI